MRQIDLKRIDLKNIVIDVGWVKLDLVFHFYTHSENIYSLDKKLDPLFKEIFDLDADDKNKILEEHRKKMENIAKEENVRNVVLYSKKLEEPHKLYKSFNSIYQDLPVKDVVDIKSWCYKLTSPDLMFLDKKIDLLFKKFEEIKF
jgi:predicted nuclease with TOPRIM domain